MANKGQVSISVGVTPEEKEAVRVYAAKVGMTPHALIRDTIRLVINEDGQFPRLTPQRLGFRIRRD